jgi:hypothetical protein
MKRMRMMGLCLVAVFAIAAIGASAASAKKVLSLSTAAGELKAGDTVSTFSSNLIFETVAGNLECEENELIGTINGNNEVKIKGSVTEEISKGSYLGIPGACKTSATGPVFITSSGFPWPIEFTTKGLGKVKGSKKVTFTSTFLAIEPPNKCTFEASTIKDSFNISETKEPVTITTTKQKFKHNKKAPEQTTLCPAEGVLSGTFSVSHASETVEGVIKNI